MDCRCRRGKLAVHLSVSGKIANERPPMRHTHRSTEPARKPAHRYTAPRNVAVMTLRELVGSKRTTVDDQQRMLETGDGGWGPRLWCAGDVSLVQSCSVAIVGTRDVSAEGAARARKLARQLVSHNIVVMSGLARGVDTAALTAAVEAGGHVIAVIGTPLEQAHPVANAALQEGDRATASAGIAVRTGSPCPQGQLP